MAHGKNNSKTGLKVLFSFSRLVSAGECLIMLLFFPFIKSLGIQEYIYLPVLALSVFLAVMSIPFLYHLINSTRTLPTGKYHLPLILSALGSGFFCISLFCIDPLSGIFPKITALFFLFTFMLIFYFVFTYVCVSVSSRLIAPPEADNEKTLLSFVGIAAFCIIFILTKEFSPYPYISAAAVTATVIILTGFAVYLLTCKYMPLFIKLKEPRKRGIKLIMERFFSSFSVKENLRVYFNLFFCAAAYMSLALGAFIFSDSFGMGNISAAAAVISFFTAHSLVFILTRNKTLSEYSKIIALVFAVCFGALALIPLYAGLTETVREVFFYSLPVFAGVSCGLNFSRITNELDGVKERAGLTNGIIMNIKNIIFITAFFTALTAVSLLSLLESYATLGIVCFFIAAAITAMIISLAKKRYLMLEISGDEDV